MKMNDTHETSQQVVNISKNNWEKLVSDHKNSPTSITRIIICQKKFLNIETSSYWKNKFLPLYCS